MLGADEVGGECDEALALMRGEARRDGDVAIDDRPDAIGVEVRAARRSTEQDDLTVSGPCTADTVGGMSDSPSPSDMWEQRYAAEQYVYGTTPNAFLVQQVAALSPGRVLCLAEGEGRNSVFLAEQGFEVHSVDLSSTGVAKTLQLAAERGVQVHAVQGDLATYDIGVGEWDAVVSIFAHMPPAVRRALHARVVAALKPGGQFILEAYTPAQLGRGTGGPQVIEMMMSLDVLRTELAPLTFVHACEIEREVVEGFGHTGVGSVVQVRAHA